MVSSEMFAYTNINSCEFIRDECKTGNYGLRYDPMILIILYIPV